MNRRSTHQPRTRYREHVAAALGATVGLLVMALIAIVIEFAS